MTKQPKAGPAQPRLRAGAIVPSIKNWHAILIIVLAVAVFFRDILLQQAFFWEDFLYYFYPVRNLAAVSIRGGEFPLWNPFTFSGMPFQADIQTAVFYLPNLLLTFFVNGGMLNFYWLEVQIIVHYMIAGVCMYYLVKDLGLENVYALASGLIFALSGFLIVHAIHQVVICQVAWVPLIILLFRRALQKHSLLWTILTGLVLGHAVLAGYPQVTLYIFLFLLLYFVFELSMSLKEKGIAASLPLVPVGAGVVLVALGLTALQLLPTMELAPLSQRAEITYQKSLEGSLSWERLITLVVPKFFGTSGASGATFWLPKIYWEYWETTVYVGIAVLVLLVFAFRSARRTPLVGFLFGMCAFGILYGLGDSFVLHKFFFSSVPGFDKFRNPARMSLFFTFAAAVLGGVGLKEFVGMVERGEKKLLQRLLIAVCALVALVWIAAQLGALQPTQNTRMYQQIHAIAGAAATTAFILGVCVCGVFFLWARRTITMSAALIVLAVIQLIDMNLFGFSQNNSSQNPEEYFSRTREITSLVKQDSAVVRVNSRKENTMILDRNQGMIDRIFLMEGYTPLALQRSYPPAKDWDGLCDLLNAKYRIRIDEAGRTMSMAVVPTCVPRAFMAFDARVIPDDAAQKAFMASDAFQPARTVVLDEDPHAPLADTSGKGSVRITRYRMNAIAMDVEASANGFLVMSEIFYPGWNAYVDGVRRDIVRADWCLRGLPIAAGSHRVEVRYEPASFARGLWITVATLVLSGGGIGYSLFRKRKRPAPPDP
jgi:hypothetical protein